MSTATELLLLPFNCFFVFFFAAEKMDDNVQNLPEDM